MLDLLTDPAHVTHEAARSVLKILQSLSRRGRTTTPYALLADALAALHVRPQLRQRFKAGAERAIANVDLFHEMSRAYDVRGLRAFARDMRSNWEEAVRQVEGRPDAEQESVSLITVHASKGLEWPIVIPVNMTGSPRTESGLMQDRRTNSFSVPILGKEPLGHAAIKSWNEQELARERVRLWYVAVTRARDLLVLPRHSAKLPDQCWSRIVDLGLEDLEGIDPTRLGERSLSKAAVQENVQTREIFAGEAALLAKNRNNIVWHLPSRDELDAGVQFDSVPLFDVSEEAAETAEIPITEIVGSSTRGTILHKLMEEILNSESRRLCRGVRLPSVQPVARGKAHRVRAYHASPQARASPRSDLGFPGAERSLCRPVSRPEFRILPGPPRTARAQCQLELAVRCHHNGRASIRWLGGLGL